MKSVVTGGKGFIGSKLAKKLLDSGDTVIVIDRDSNGIRHQHPNITYCNVDLSLISLEYIKHYFEGADRVFHLAADISVPISIEKPYNVSVNNTISTLKVLETCKELGIKRVILSSTCAVYAEKTYPIYSEYDLTNPLNPYSASKLYGENMFKMYADLYRLETVVLRYFNVYGNLSQSNQYSAVINKFLNNSKKGLPLTIFGDGEQSRDFIHVDDVVDANIISSEAQLKQYGEVFNIGSGRNTTIKKLASYFSDDIRYEEPKKGEIKLSCADTIKSKRILGWDCKVDLEKWISGVK